MGMTVPNGTITSIAGAVNGKTAQLAVVCHGALDTRVVS